MPNIKALDLPVSKKRILKMGFFVPKFQLVSPGAGPILTPRHHMNKLGRGPQGNAIYQISKLYACQFQRRRILKMFQLVTRGVGPVLTPGASYEQTWLLQITTPSSTAASRFKYNT